MNWEEIVTRARNGNSAPPRRVEKSEAQWKSELDEDVFYVTRKSGTERPFSSDSCALFEPGIYQCACCKTHLFDAQTKFDSGSGWPSFTDPIEENVVAYHSDRSLFVERIEATCAVCDAHLGHVFPDGPPPTGLRYCMNAVALEKVD